MNEAVPSTSSSIVQNDQNDLLSLGSQGIQIWGASQKVLEEQALKELEIFVKNTNESKQSQIQIKEDDQRFKSYIEKPCTLQNVTVPLITNNEDGNTLEPSTSNYLENLFEDDFSKSIRRTTHSHSENDESGRETNNDTIWHEDLPEDSESEYFPSENELDEDYNFPKKSPGVQKIKSKTRKKISRINNVKLKDDASEVQYKARLEEYYKRLENEMQTLGLAENYQQEYKKIKGGLKVPQELWNKLYDYQKEGVKWLWFLHQNSTGGLLGDEMGLGKTVQVIVFLHAVRYSQIISGKFRGVGPSIIVCPATVVYQWVKHFYDWSPEFRIAILHQSGSFQGNKAKLIEEINKSKGIIVTTYAGIIKYKGNLCDYNWHYLILDEGHKIRNPNAKVTIATKSIRTPYRILLTGSPMQNNLTELWSLFDFTNPGMLGSLSTFTEHFANPILQGGFANASTMQEATALSVASSLKNLISPYLLRRMKVDVQEHIQLPHKSEQVLFCSLTDEQRHLYKNYLMSEQVNNILGRGIKNWRSDNFMKANMLMAITALRKICNHPDLFLHDKESKDSYDESLENKYGYYKRSGKMVVVSALLKIWKKQGHRTLVFSQGRSMLTIFEKFFDQQGYKYLKMDGTTNIKSRQGLIEKFNTDTSYNVFLLTTRVGGLGINLTGANKVIIYDPDWNPATDSQAKERAWRIGQDKAVTVYRLLLAGTVEEKMYQRQVWKQLLSNKVLIDPTTNKFFKSSDLFDLFSLPESPEMKPETTNIFRDSRIKVEEKLEEKKKRKKQTENNEKINKKIEFSEDKIQAMKILAQQISKSLTTKQDKPKKTSYQIELIQNREHKLKEKQKLKQLSPQELIEYNRRKANKTDEYVGNKIDDCEASVSFDKALDYCSKTADLYHKLPSKNINESVEKLLPNSTDTLRNENSIKEVTAKDDLNKKIKKRKRKEVFVDTSGKIDGQEVEGLVKREKKKVKISNDSQENYILEHLFSKKGVSGALEHESVLNGGKKQQSLKVRTYAEEKALKALDALKKSRLKNWKY